MIIWRNATDDLDAFYVAQGMDDAGCRIVSIVRDTSFKAGSSMAWAVFGQLDVSKDDEKRARDRIEHAIEVRRSA